MTAAHSQKNGYWTRCAGMLCAAAGLLFALPSTVVAQQAAAPAQATPAPYVQGEYRIGPGDDLTITFPNNYELNHTGPVGPDGRVPLPLLGNVLLAGNTQTQAAAMIRNILRDKGIAADAVPDITIAHYGTTVYVGGQVKSPGAIQLVSGMDLLQAIIAAGGMTDTARTGQVAVIRRTADNHANVMYFSVKDYQKGKPQGLIATLEPRDVIFVPRSKIAEVDMWVDNYINKTLPFSRGLSYSYGNYPVTSAAVSK